MPHNEIRKPKKLLARETRGQNLVIDLVWKCGRKLNGRKQKKWGKGQSTVVTSPRQKAEQPRGTPSNPGYQHYQMVLSEEDQLAG